MTLILIVKKMFEMKTDIFSKFLVCELRGVISFTKLCRSNISYQNWRKLRYLLLKCNIESLTFFNKSAWHHRSSWNGGYGWSIRCLLVQFMWEGKLQGNIFFRNFEKCYFWNCNEAKRHSEFGLSKIWRLIWRV